tara:strand:+ start:2336 stop:3136 length:801 start_codon:yes stop_codon:yes gene_type:complete
MTSVAIAGAAGRMGRSILKAVSEDARLQITHAYEQIEHPLLGAEVGSLTGISSPGLYLSDSIEDGDFDVLIDFTSPSSTMSNLEFCHAKNRNIVIGTTGLDTEQKVKIKNLSEDIAIVLAPNMSIGVNLILKLIELACRTLGDSVDIEILEAHHRHKIDAPSGTAIKMGEVVANTLERNLKTDGVYSRHGQVGERQEKSIGFSTIRAADIVGEHSIWFAGLGERVEISHKATSRDIYAQGATRAALWLASQSNGLYDMQDVLGLSF